MRELVVGLLLLVGWGVLQFSVQPATGWFHLLLIAGVGLVIRGIVLRDAGRPAGR